MQDILSNVNEFFKSPIGVIILSVLAALGASAVSRIRQRTEVQNKIDASVAASQQETQALLHQREAQNLADREAIRKLFMRGQERLDALTASNEALERKLDEAQAEAALAKTASAACSVQITELKGQVDKAKAELEAKTVELEERLRDIAGLRTANDTLISSNYDLMQANEVLQLQMKSRNKELEEERAKNGHLQAEITELQSQVETLKAQVAQLQAKVGTGELDPSKVPDTDPALKPTENKPSEDTP